ncbi:hypothetical protein CUC08_Gglean005068 [Alternaria sp. MG1]|nr:hypothetical protein CUC08_Gglean005068 [Alternaria sp. MG1]
MSNNQRNPMNGQAYINNKRTGRYNISNKMDSTSNNSTNSSIKEARRRVINITRILAILIILIIVRMEAAVDIALQTHRIIWVSRAKEEGATLIIRILIRVRGLMMICGRIGSVIESCRASMVIKPRLFHYLNYASFYSISPV